MTVWVLTRSFTFESYDIIGIYSTREKAKLALEEWINNEEDGYISYSISKWNIDHPWKLTKE